MITAGVLIDGNGLTEIPCPKCQENGKEKNLLWRYDRGDFIHYECDLLACDYKRIITVNNE
ncbi:hypothetical protein P4261_28090 [Bacillus thuringiensis]|nr:hypothetical protein [Bacillus thuringiensis]MED2829743.1 hypothetical protein [Bacillus thuringiensis]MED2856396.1 hypothetical protein [Bacillus thuringiensis]MED2863799.1 hypothetical protein [Bacillus thuringiensis]